MHDSRIGVSVMTFNRAAEVARTVEKLSALPEAPEIVVVDNGSTDDTSGRLEACPNVRYIRLPANRGASARNVGVAALTSPYVALCDDDSWWEPGSLRTAADLMDTHPRVAVLTAKVLVGKAGQIDSTSRLMAESPLSREPGLPGPTVLGFMAGACVVRRDAFLAAGGFERRLFLGGEEELLTIDLVSSGWLLSYSDKLCVRHLPSAARDDAQRQHLLLRNHLWTTWLRRRPRTVAAVTSRMAWAATREPVARKALLDATRGFPWALRGRRAISTDLERNLRTVAAARTLQGRRTPVTTAAVATPFADREATP